MDIEDSCVFSRLHYLERGVRPVQPDDRLSVDRAAAVACRVRARIEGDAHARRLLPAPGLLERLRGRPWGVSQPEVNAILRRSRYFDHTLARFLIPPTGQLVLLEGRYDTRPWRFADELADRRIFASAPEFASGRTSIDPTVSLSAGLRKACFERNERTLFLWEGGTMYRSRAQVKATLSALRSLCGPGSVLVLDGWSHGESPVHFRPTLLGEPIRFAIHPEDLSGLLGRMGFEVTDVADGEELRRRFPPEGGALYGSHFVMSARLTGL